MNLKDKKMIFFDLDGTLAKSKLPMSEEMSASFCRLLKTKRVAVAGGGSEEQFSKQFLENLNCDLWLLKNLYLLPTSASALFEHDGKEWRKIYGYDLSETDKSTIRNAIGAALKTTGYMPPKKAYGETIEDRKSQISFSGLGQQAPLELKKNWDPDREKRKPIVEELKKLLPEFDVRMGGTTTIDINKRGINKAFGVRELTTRLNLKINEAVYIGDALYENGNDEIVKETGIETIQVSGPEETQQIIDKITKENSI